MHTALLSRAALQGLSVQICLPKGTLANSRGGFRLAERTARLCPTRSGELGDQFIEAGQAVELADGDRALIEADFATEAELSPLH